MTLETKGFLQFRNECFSAGESFDFQVVYVNSYCSRAWYLGAEDGGAERIWSSSFFHYACSELGDTLDFSGVSATSLFRMIYGEEASTFEKLLACWERYRERGTGLPSKISSAGRNVEILGEKELVEAILQYPCAYLGRRSVQLLGAYFSGIAAADREFGSPQEMEIMGEAWRETVTEVLEVPGEYPWWRKFIFTAAGDDLVAFDRFASEWKQFIEAR